MLEFLWRKASDRKLRLFAVACCRRIEKYLWSRNVGHRAISTAERYADGLGKDEELETARNLVQNQLELYPEEPVYDASYWACGVDMLHDADMSAHYAANNSTSPVDQGADDFDVLCEQRRGEEK